MTKLETYISTLGECAEFSSGGTPSKKNPEYWGGQIPWVSAKDMKQIRLYKTKDYITKKGAENGTYVVPEGTILILVRGMTLYNDVPICLTKKDMAFNQDVKAIKPKPSVVDSEYLVYSLLSNKPYLLSLVDSASHGTGRIHTEIIKAVQINLPPLPEQQAIAQALSDADAAIEFCDRLITKKRNIKQGAMQQLLTGKKRLPGFSHEWEQKKFYEVTDVITCGLAATPQYVNESVGIPFLSSTNIKNGVIRWNDYKYISKKLHQNLYKNNPPLRGNILYSRVGTIGEAAIIDVDFAFSIYVSLTLIKPKSILHNEFLKQLLNSSLYKERAKNQVYVGGGVGNLNVDVVRQYPIPLPLWEEQKAIAQVLSDMDTEIEALEQKRDKYKAIKQGMMQELLTGRTRLV